MSIPETPEQQDERELREIEGGMREVMGLLTQRHTREGAAKQLEILRARRDEHASNPQLAMHIDGATRAPTTMRTKTQLDLAEALEVSIALHRHPPSLETALSMLSERRVAVLERILARGAPK